MFNNYSGTYAAAISMFAIPLLVRWFSEDCASQIVNIGVPALVAGALMVTRYMKGGVTRAGVKM